MPNPRIAAYCNRCGFERPHSTRSSGAVVRPCVLCSRAMAAKRAERKAEDPEWQERRRQQYAKYNASEKGKARLARARDTAEAAAQPQESPQEPQPDPIPVKPRVSSSRRRKRRSRAADGFM